MINLTIEMLIVFTVLSYLIGSIPTAYILLKKKHNIDITKVGSGNVGAMNSFEITKSKKVGLFVLIIDFLKGFLPVFILKLFFNVEFYMVGLVLFATVFGHCFSVWLKFKGGRGLATALGGSVIFIPFVPLIWGLLWIMVYSRMKDVLIANISATILAQIVSIVLYRYLIGFCFPMPGNIWIFFCFILLILNLILFKHKQPLLEILRKK